MNYGVKNWQVLTLKDSKEWIKLVEACEQPDLHFLPSFMKLFEDKMDGKAMLLVSHHPSKENFFINRM